MPPHIMICNVSITNIRFNNARLFDTMCLEILGGLSMSRRIANFLFVLATISWASSYLFTKFAVNELQPFTLIAMRFSIAFIVTFALFYRKLLPVSKDTLKASAVLGALMCLMFTIFNVVLKTVNPSTAGFLLATTVVFVPLIMMLFTRELPQRQIKIGTIVTFTGLSIFMFNGSLFIDSGVILCLVTALLFASHLVVNNRFTKSHDALQLGVFQLGFASLFGGIFMLLFEQPHVPTSKLGWVSIIVLAVICSAFGFVVQSVAQKYTSAEETGFILALEPVFSAFFAYLALGEVLANREWIGALIVLIGVFIASHQPKVAPISHTISDS